MVKIRSGRGLGDSIYLRAIVEHLVAAGHQVTARSDYPEVFTGSRASIEPFTRATPCTVAHYTQTMGDQSCTQFAAMLRSAKIAEDVPLRFAWTVQNAALIADLRSRAAGRRIILVHGGRAPMQRSDGFGLDMVPRAEVFCAALEALAGCCLVRIGNAPHLYRLPTDVDLNGSTTVSDVMDIASICDGVVAQCSFAVPLAEVFDRPLLAIWAAAGLKSNTPYVRLITPAKVLTKLTSQHVIDDAPEWSIAGWAHEWQQTFLRTAKSPNSLTNSRVACAS